MSDDEKINHYLVMNFLYKNCLGYLVCSQGHKIAVLKNLPPFSSISPGRKF